MLSSIGSRWALDRYVIALSLAIAGCASSGDAIPPAAIPEPLAMAGPEPIRHGTRAVPKPDRLPTPRKPVRAPVESEARAPARRPSAVRVDSAALERAVTQRFAYQPLSIALAQRTRKTELADRIAASVVYEAARLRMSPSLLAAVLLIENAPFDTTAISSQGAVGLMQVMQVHVGSYGCSSEDLNTVEANICHGARLLHTYIRRSKSVPLGLKRYNGCVHGRNTPRCYRYPARVLRTASKVRHDLLLAAARLEEEQGDDLAADTPSQPASVPSQPVIDPDSTITTTSASECTTFIGCLKHRWTQR
ncbi:MAG: transglycosylase SLT domain-containing protein [Gemmatimonadales bacterium]